MVHQQLHVIRNTAHRPSTQASYRARRVRPKGKISCVAAQIAATYNSRLDYCNSLLFGVGEGLMDRLQRVQDAAARLVSGAKKYDHITPIMTDLHWLPIRRRVTFKMATLVYKCLHGCVPATSPMTASLFRRFLVVGFCVRRRIWY